MKNKEYKIKSLEEEEVKKEIVKTSRRNFWSWLKYLAMKWRFRLDQARAIFGLLTFAALLSITYLPKIPWFQDQLFWRGEFLLTFLVLFFFMIGGYLYDRFLRLWTENVTVSVERNPYTYVPQPKELIVSLGWFTHIFSALKQIADKLEIELEGEELMKQQLTHYLSLTVDDSDFEVQASKLKRLTAIMLESYIESENVGDFDEFLADLESYVAKKNELK
ncbi:MAG: hypothetical protein KAX09_10230 [Candidatus Heimdallarchaeota archaeon]|nr:hypothetical protein [Candidatus Heimdallarchaeota archaeon]MCK4291348.1 hypothetical protein [Candidatus Heimdallarchaeota archaeon]